jgi:glucose-1-phosphate cytidylyltransferase
MNVVILAGGRGTRLAEETDTRPKPLVEIGDRPILWHIMKTYGTQGFADMFVASGYKAPMIARYFADQSAASASLLADLGTGSVAPLGSEGER